DKLGARTPEQARDRTGLRSLGELLSVVDRKDHKLLQAQLLVAWLWALGRDEDLGDGALTNEARLTGYGAARSLRNMLEAAKMARAQFVPEHRQLWPAVDTTAPAHLEVPRLSSGRSEEAVVAPAIFMAPSLPLQGVLGRAEVLAELGELLALDRAGATEVPPVVLRGMGGIGKTTLAAAFSRQSQVARSFPDGILWVALGPSPPVR